MQHRLVLALVCAAFAGVVRIGAAPLDHPALSLQIGKLVLSSDEAWSGGKLSGSLAADFPVSATIAPTVVLGTSRGLHAVFGDENVELTSDYLVGAVRVTPRPDGAVRAYLLAGYGLLRANAREDVTDPYSGRISVYEHSSTGGTALLAVGMAVAVPESRLAFVAEISSIVPHTSTSGFGSGSVPGQILATAGIRVTLGR
jgi:hypothetical protein